MAGHVVAAPVLLNPSQTEWALLGLVLHVVLRITPTLGMATAAHLFTRDSLVRRVVAVGAEFKVARSTGDFGNAAVDIDDDAGGAVRVGTGTEVLHSL